MNRAMPALKIAGRGAAKGLAVVAMIYIVIIPLALVTGTALEIPGVIRATGSITNDASSVEAWGNPLIPLVAVIIGAGVALLWTPRRRMHSDQSEIVVEN